MAQNGTKGLQKPKTNNKILKQPSNKKTKQGKDQKKPDDADLKFDFEELKKHHRKLIEVSGKFTLYFRKAFKRVKRS